MLSGYQHDVYANNWRGGSATPKMSRFVLLKKEKRIALRRFFGVISSQMAGFFRKKGRLEICIRDRYHHAVGAGFFPQPTPA